MNPVQLLTHFDRISDAPDAILRLRRFILKLANRGKLVEQDPRDKPVSDLLKHIRAKNGQLEVASDPFTETEQPFTIPQSWAWIQLGDATHVEMGQSPPSESYNQTGNGIPFYQGKTDFGLRFPTPRYWCNQPSKLAQKDDILISVRAPVGPINVASEACCIGRGLAALRPHPGVYLEFLLYSLKGLESAIAAMGYGTTFVAITKKQLVSFTIPLPPLAEQHRIVTKVDELMALCDRVETAQAERESRRDRLVASSLNRLNNGENVGAFRDHARFYFNHLPRLTTKPEHIQQLRQTILNLAVLGKLVPQDPHDEPASELLKRIQAEKIRLVKEGKIGSEKPPIPARVDELAFELKPGWQVARISQILVELQTGPFGSSLHQSDYQKSGVPVINPASIKNERLVPVKSMAVGPETLKRLSTFKLRAGDIVMARRGEMGRCAVVTKHEDGWLCGTGSLILRLPTCVFSRFLVTLIGSPIVREYLGGSAVGATMQNLNQSILLNLVVGLPPLAEQQRIIAKVDELMALCDRLKAQLTTTHTDSCRLLEAMLHKAIALAV